MPYIGVPDPDPVPNYMESGAASAWTGPSFSASLDWGSNGPIWEQINRQTAGPTPDNQWANADSIMQSQRGALTAAGWVSDGGGWKRGGHYLTQINDPFYGGDPWYDITTGRRYTGSGATPDSYVAAPASTPASYKPIYNPMSTDMSVLPILPVGTPVDWPSLAPSIPGTPVTTPPTVTSSYPLTYIPSSPVNMNIPWSPISMGAQPTQTPQPISFNPYNPANYTPMETQITGSASSTSQPTGGTSLTSPPLTNDGMPSTIFGIPSSYLMIGVAGFVALMMLKK